MMAGLRILVLMVLGGLMPLSLAQQFPNTTMFTAYTGLSSECQEALSTNITCSTTLEIIAQSNGVMTSDEVAAVCVNECYTSLESARTVIATACTLDTDVIVFQDIAYPATFIADNYLFTYQVSCRKDSSTGEYCDPIIASWANQTMTATEQCSDCWLGGLALQLGNPLGYDASLATNYASLIASCNATAYSYTTPTQYAINATATATATTVTTTAASDCTESYTVEATDDCNSVAQALNVSTYSLLYSNGLDIYCQNFAAAVNSTLCIPPQCDTYVWQLTDDCDSVVGSLTNVTVPQFLSWNPNFNALCRNAVNFIGYTVCISPPGGYLNHTTAMTSNSTTPGTNITTAVAVPTNAVEGTNTDCGAWYTIVTGDTCSLVSVANEISLTDFYFLNPEIDANCTNLLLGESYCVAPVGSITTYASYPVTTPLFTVTSATFSSVDTSIPTATSDPGYIYTPTYYPTAPSTKADCATYRNYTDTTNIFFARTGTMMTMLNSCKYVAFAYQITTDQLIEWNPSLSTNESTCALQPGYSYCVLETDDSTTADDSGTFCLSINATESTTVSNCNCFTKVLGYMNGVYTCANIIDDIGITEAELLAWNPWLASDCDTDLYADLTGNDIRAVCIGIDTNATSTTSSNSAAPTPTDTISGCQEFYTVVSGDDCSGILTEFGITVAQFYAWNPSVGSTCTNLWLDEAYCVKGPATTATTATATGTTTRVAPTQTGIVSDCDEYYTVVDDDSCANIETLYGITFAELYEWNPAIGSDCESLLVGYAVCVAVSS